MTAHADPWEKRPNDSGFDFKPLFKSTDEFSLSELNIPKTHCVPFSAGQTIGVFHSHGIIHGDLRSRHMFFNARTGRTRLIDFGASKKSAVNPRSMATEFIIPFTEMDLKTFQAFLTGYVNESLTDMDNKYPNYTTELLAYLGGRVVYLPTPQPLPDWVGTLLEQMQIELEYKESKFQLRAKSHEINPELWNQQLGKIVSLFAGLIVAGLDCSSLFKNAANPPGLAGQAKYALEMFSALYQGQLPNPNREFESGTLELSLRFLRRLQTEAGFRHVSQPRLLGISTNKQPDLLATSILFNALRESDPPTIISFIDDLIDICDFIALRLDASDSVDTSTPQARRSIEFAQHSWVLFGYCFFDLRMDERRCLTEHKRHNRLSWTNRLLAENPNFGEFLAFLAYRNSKSNALMQLFNNSLRARPSEASNKLWSCLWESLNISRRHLLEMSRQVSDTSNVPHSDTLQQLASHLAKMHLQILHQQMSAVMTGGDLFHLSSLMDTKGPPFSKEVEWAGSLAKYLEKNSVMDQEGKRLLASGNNFFA